MLDVRIARCFNATFARDYGCVLVGGAREPYYYPGQHRAILRYRQNFAASALHEAAHWCIAGAARRRRMDFGYWYNPPPRSAIAQAKFARVEGRVQALEQLFCQAAGLIFRPSMDDVDATDDAALTQLVDEIEQAAAVLRTQGLPPRAERFAHALSLMADICTE